MFTGVTDLTFALRQLRRSPTFSLVAVATLALGIGANTAIFSVLEGVALRPLPYPEPGRLVRVWPQQVFTKALLVEFERESRSVSGMAGYQQGMYTLTGGAEPEEVAGASVSPGYFGVVGVAPALGRGFTKGEEAPGGGDVVVLSWGLWQRRYGGDASIIGRRVQVEGGGASGPRTVVGVMPEGFRPLSEGRALWTPLTIDAGDFPDYRGTAGTSVVARLAAGVSLEAANAEIHDLAARLTANQNWIPDASRATAGVERVQDVMVGGVRSRLTLLLGAVVLVLLIACANVANLLLARMSGRQREMGIRLALGAGSGRLTRQILTESVLLGLIGGGAGVLLITWLLPALVAALPADMPRVADVKVSGVVLLFALGLSVAAGLVFGLVPAFQAGRSGIRETLAEARPGGTSTRHGLNRWLVGGELGLAVVLVVAAALMLKSFWRLQGVDPGFRAANVVTLRLGPPETRYGTAAALRAYYDDVLGRLRAVPGVRSAGAINMLPVTGSNMAMRFGALDRANTDELPANYANVRAVAGDYFSAMSIPVLDGSVADAARASGPAVVVNEALVRATWPGERAVGRELELPTGDQRDYRVAAVVGDVRQHNLDQAPRPEVYFPYRLWPAGRMYVAVLVAGNARGVMPALRAAIWSVDDQVPITLDRTMDQVVGRSMADSRLLTRLLVAFGVLALGLGALGVYGVTAYTVSQSTFEIGVRMALGAERNDILRDVLGRTLLTAGAGIVVGAVAAALTARLLAGYLYEVRAADPVVLAGVVLFLALVATLAACVPALRASRVDPLQALRLD